MNSPMHPRIVIANQVKCNFCFNWITGEHLVKYSINACKNCLDKYVQNTFTIYTQTSETYLMTLYNNQLEDNHNQQNSTDFHNVIATSSQKHQTCLQQIIPEQTVSEYEQQPQDIQTYRIIHKPLTKQSKALEPIRTSNIQYNSKDNSHSQSLKQHQSLIFTTPSRTKPHQQFFTHLKKTKLEDFGRSLDKTRFISRYQFHFQPETIEQFIEEHPKIQERTPKNNQFGQQLDSNQLNQSRSVKSKINQTFRSKISNSSFKNQKMCQEEVKMKISSIFQNKHRSETLTRLMTTQIKEVYQKTNISHKTLELIGFKLTNIDLQAYFKMFDFNQINIIKLLNVGLTDDHIPILIQFIQDKPVQSLVLTGNKLTQNCLSYFIKNSLPNIKQLYLGNNRINKSKYKQNVIQLHKRYILYL